MAKQTKKMLAAAMTVLIFCLAFVIHPPASIGAEKGPIKIGFISPITGNFAQFGLDMVSGAKMFLETKNYTVAGICLLAFTG